MSHMLFVQPIKGGVVVEATYLACVDGAGASCDHLSGDDQSLGQNIAIDRRTRQVVEDPIDLGRAHVDRLGDIGEGNILQQVDVDIIDELSLYVVFSRIAGWLILFLKKHGIDCVKQCHQV